MPVALGEPNVPEQGQDGAGDEAGDRSVQAPRGRGDRGAGRGSGRGGRGGGGRGDRGPRGGRRGPRDRGDQEGEGPRYEERVVQINRCATTVKGGRRMSFSALVVVGDRKGQVGIGFGKAKAVPNAVEKALKDARKKLVRVNLVGNTIPHEVMGRFGASKVMLLPASTGTGVIAGASSRAVLECVGVQDILTKCYKSTNPCNLAKATLEGLSRLRTKAQVEQTRGVSLA